MRKLILDLVAGFLKTCALNASAELALFGADDEQLWLDSDGQAA